MAGILNATTAVLAQKATGSTHALRKDQFDDDIALSTQASITLGDTSNIAVGDERFPLVKQLVEDGAGGYTHTLQLDDPGDSVVRILSVRFAVEASTNPVVNIRDGVGLTTIHTITGTGVAFVEEAIFVFDGTNWIAWNN